MVMYVMFFVYSLNDDFETNYNKICQKAANYKNRILSTLLFLPFIMFGINASI
jgi:hypothetical protein